MGSGAKIAVYRLPDDPPDKVIPIQGLAGHKAGRPRGPASFVKERRLSIDSPEEVELKLNRFLDFLEENCQVGKSAKLAGLSPVTVSDRRKEDPMFEQAFQDSYAAGVESMEEEAVRRAMHGVEKAVYYKGDVVGETIEYSDTLLTFMLKAARPDKYKDRSQNENLNVNLDLAARLDAATKRMQNGD